MRLAALLGATEREAKQRVSQDEFYRWMAFYAVEPWGRNAETLQQAKIGAAVCQAWGASRKAEEFVTADPAWWRERESSGDEFGDELQRVFG